MEQNRFSWKQLESLKVRSMRGLTFESMSSRVSESVYVNTCGASIFNYCWGKFRRKTL